MWGRGGHSGDQSAATKGGHRGPCPRLRCDAHSPPCAHHLGSLGSCQARGMRGSEPEFASAPDRASAEPLARGVPIVCRSPCLAPSRQRFAILLAEHLPLAEAFCCTTQCRDGQADGLAISRMARQIDSERAPAAQARDVRRVGQRLDAASIDAAQPAP